MASTRGQFLGGESVVFDGVATVGDIMLRVARDEHRFASDVVVLPVGSGEVLEHDRTPPPDVCVVLKKEEDKLSAEECQTNVILYAEAEDTTTVARALAMLEDVSPDTPWSEDMLLKAARDPTKEKTVRTLVRAGVDGGNALSSASAGGDAATVQRLIDAGLKVDNCSKAFWLASHYGHKEVVQILLEARADVDSVYEGGESPLWHASVGGHKEVVQILLDAGADVNFADKGGGSPLWHASGNGHKEVVQILLDAGADVNFVDEDGESALWEASCCGHKEVVQVLIEARADVNCVDEGGGSALSAASDYEHKEVVQILLDAGARPL